MRVDIHWKFADNEEDKALDLYRVLYAYTDGVGEVIHYIGKADFCSVRERLKGKHKQDVFGYLSNTLELQEYGILIGEFELDEGRKLSSHLISDWRVFKTLCQPSYRSM